VIIHELRDGRSLPAALDAAVEVLARRRDADEVLGALDFARQLSLSDLARDVTPIGEGWVAEEALTIAVYCALVHVDDFAAAIRLAANHSRDSDSTAAITGNILGTHLGVTAIPAGWLAVLELRATIDRIAIALHDRDAVPRPDDVD
jgi:ADP-ribosylglycohydrolase